ncbi:MAG: response regulator [Armatimonadetes bacterium]|nr:response regulator [Armatimonadota bacterium]
MAEPAKILVVDDDPDIVESLRLVLQSAGYDVDTALTTQEAFAKVDSYRPDLILLDIMMPDGTEGFHFVWKLRNQYPEEEANIPILVLSAIHHTTQLRFYPEQSDGTYQPGEFLPVQGFIDKPVEPSVLLGAIKEVLASREK